MDIINYYKEKEDIYSKLLNFAKKNDWKSIHQIKYFIHYCYEYNDYIISSTRSYRRLGMFYFNSKRIAQEFINKYKENLKEYSNKRINYDNSLLNRIAKIAKKNNKIVNCNDVCRFYISYDYFNKKITVNCQTFNPADFGTIYFSSEKLAQEIINKYHDELIGYFEGENI